MKNTKKISILLLVFSLCAFLSTPVFAAKKPLIIYTSMETDETVEYVKLAREELPDLDIKIIRLSTGELGARMLAERTNPQADVVWGWAVTNMEDFRDRGLLEKYKPNGWEKIPANFKDPNGYWTAIDLYTACFVLNTKVMEEENLPKPKTWRDLLNPVYKDKLIMPNPASSGTGFLQVASLLEMLDPDYAKKPVKKNKGWEFLEKLEKTWASTLRADPSPPS